jgi:hypothetical protein
MFGRALLFVILLNFIIVGFISRGMNTSNRRQTENLVAFSYRHDGRNIAQSGVNLALAKLAADTSWREGIASEGSPLGLFGGTVFVTAADTTFFGKKVVRVRAVATTAAGTSFARSDTSTAFVFRAFIPGSVRAAITTNNDVMTNGDLIVDGREHTIDGTLIPDAGRWALWTTRNYLMPAGSSTMGGTPDSPRTDIAPVGWPADSVVIRTNQVWPGGTFPGSPDSVFGGANAGFPEGTLKAIARSGIGGSQYTSNPATLTYPLRGVTYVETATSGPAQTWSPANITGSGVLVVHNTARNAIIKNLQVDKDKDFRGLLISDDIDKMNGAVIIGAVMSLKADLSAGNVIGNGSGEIYYSSEAIGEATTSFLKTKTYGSKNNVLAWWE